MTSIKKQAYQDASEYARAQLFHGEGAGIRRNLIGGQVAGKSARYKEYGKLFDEALAQQDWADHATKAVRERKRIDAGKFLKRNGSALVTGRTQNLSTGIAVAVAVYAIANQTGADEVIGREMKKAYKKAETEVKVFRAKRKLAKAPKA